MVIGMFGLLNQTPQNVYNPNPIVQKVSVPKTPVDKPVKSSTNTDVVKENKSGKITGPLGGWIAIGVIGQAAAGNPEGAKELAKVIGLDLFPNREPVRRRPHAGACTSYNHVCP